MLKGIMSKDETALFLVSFVVFAALTNGYMVENDVSRMATIESLVEHNTLSIDNSSIQPNVDKIFVQGRFYSDKPPLLSVIGAAPYFVLSSIGLHFRNHTELVYRLVTLSVVGVSSSMAAVFFFRLLGRMQISRRQRFFYTFFTFTSTPLLNYTLTLNNHTVAAALALAAVYFLVESRYGVNPSLNVFLSATVAGFCVGVDIPTGLIFVFFCGVYASTSAELRKYLPHYILGLISPFFVIAALNVNVLGDLKPSLLHPENYRFPGSKFFNTDESSLDGYPQATSRAHYLFLSLFGLQGFLTNTPLNLIALAATILAAFDRSGRIRHEALSFGSAAFCVILFNLLFTSSYGGSAYSFRYMIPATPVLCLFVPQMVGHLRSVCQKTALLFVLLFSFFMSSLYTIPYGMPWMAPHLSSFSWIAILSSLMSMYVLSSKSIRNWLFGFID